MADFVLYFDFKSFQRLERMGTYEQTSRCYCRQAECREIDPD